MIKVVTGVRRCGKSTLLALFQEHLKKEKVPESHIINVSLEGIENEELRIGKALYQYIRGRLKTDAVHYVFIDEVQLATNYEEAVNSLRLLKNVDLYVTGSNSNLLSGKLATRWAGRYVEIKMLPLSFKEYAGTFSNAKPDIIFRNYIEYSSFPEVLGYYGKTGFNEAWDKRGVRDYLEAIYIALPLFICITSIMFEPVFDIV